MGHFFPRYFSAGHLPEWKCGAPLQLIALCEPRPLLMSGPPSRLCLAEGSTLQLKKVASLSQLLTRARPFPKNISQKNMKTRGERGKPCFAMYRLLKCNHFYSGPPLWTTDQCSLISLQPLWSRASKSNERQLKQCQHWTAVDLKTFLPCFVHQHLLDLL